MSFRGGWLMSSFETVRSDCGFLHMFLKSWNSWRVRRSINLNLLFFWMVDVDECAPHICRSVPTAYVGRKGLMIRNPVSRYISNPFGCESCTLSNGWLEKGNWVNRAYGIVAIGCSKLGGLNETIRKIRCKRSNGRFSFICKEITLRSRIQWLFWVVSFCKRWYSLKSRLKDHLFLLKNFIILYSIKNC